jgi:hypothetical protein
MLTLTLMFLTAGPGFREVSTSSATLTAAPTETWKITNVTYELESLQLEGKSTRVLMRQTETMEFQASTNERPRHFVLEGFVQFGPKAKPALRFEADGESVKVWSTFYEVRSSISIHETITLFDLDTQKRFLVASSNYDRVVGMVDGKYVDQLVGYEVLEANGVHGRLVLSSPSGATRSEVTFRQKEGAPASPWGPKITASREKVRLEFGEQVVVVPIEGGRLNGKAESVMQLP